VISASGAHEQLTKEELTARIGIELKAALGELPSPQWSQVITEKARDVFLHAFARQAGGIHRDSRPGARGRLRGERIPGNVGSRRTQRDRCGDGGGEELTLFLLGSSAGFT